MSAVDGKHTHFVTAVPTVSRFPLPIMIFGGVMLAINVVAFLAFLLFPGRVIPGFAASNMVQEVGFMLAGRQLGATAVLALALFRKNVRLFQLAWLLAILREVTDAAGALVSGSYGGAALGAVFLIAEMAAFIYLGRIASGHVAKYVPQANNDENEPA